MIYKIKYILGFEAYKIDTDGFVWTNKMSPNNTWIKKKRTIDNYGYYHVSLQKNGTQYTSRIYRLVLETFCGIPPKGMEACHNNGIKTDDRLSNLRWDTRKSNQLDRNKHGTGNLGERNGQSKLVAKDIIKIRKLSKKGKTNIEVAKIFNVSGGHISCINNYKLWKHI